MPTSCDVGIWRKPACLVTRALAIVAPDVTSASLLAAEAPVDRLASLALQVRVDAVTGRASVHKKKVYRLCILFRYVDQPDQHSQSTMPLKNYVMAAPSSTRATVVAAVFAAADFSAAVVALVLAAVTATHTSVFVTSAAISTVVLNAALVG